jgi:hypothetical protein
MNENQWGNSSSLPAKPSCAVPCCAVIPIHLSSNFLGEHTAEGQAVSQSNLMALTMGNLKPEAKTLWWVGMSCKVACCCMPAQQHPHAA